MATLVTVVGNLVKDPELKNLDNGNKLAKIRVASTERVQDGNGGFKDGDTAYYDIACWRTLADNVSNSLQKGNKVIVHGKLKYREFTRKDGTKGNSFEIDATEVGQAMSIKSKSGDANPWSSGNTSKVNSSTEGNPWD
jgi:single-strand DNA-binding protein